MSSLHFCQTQSGRSTRRLTVQSSSLLHINPPPWTCSSDRRCDLQHTRPHTNTTAAATHTANQTACTMVFFGLLLPSSAKPSSQNLSFHPLHRREGRFRDDSAGSFCFAESAPERSSRVRVVLHFFAFAVGFSGLHKQCLRIVSCFAKVAAQSHTLSLLRKDVSLYMVADLCGFCLTCVLFLFQFFPPHHHMHQVLVRQHPRFLLQS